MPQHNQPLQPDESDRPSTPSEVARSTDDLGFAYGALLSEPVWQLDGLEGFSEEPRPIAPDLSNAAEPEKPDNRNGVGSVPSSPETIPLRRIIEALLFLGGEPLTPERASALVRGLTPAELLRTIDGLNRAYRVQGRPYLIRPWKNGYELAMRPPYLPVVQKLHGTTREARMSPNAIDVLALVAYRQPITKLDVDSLRGVESGSLLRLLVRRGLLSVSHEDSAPKSESVYRTTQRFLDLFQLRCPEDLPQTLDLKRL